MSKTIYENYGPVVVMANNYQFAGNEKLIQPCIESRMLLWCKAGSGDICVNRQCFRMIPNAFFLLPWRRQLEYHPDKDTPFLVAGIHFIPRYAKNHKVEFEVAHSRSHRLFDKPWRGDALPGKLPEFLAGSFEWNQPLKLLAEYIVSDFENIRQNEAAAEIAGKLLCVKLVQAGSRNIHGISASLRLRQILEYLRKHVSEKISIGDMADAGQCSPSTVIRLFRIYLKMTPIQWLLQLRMTQAADLLNNTGLSAGEIGRRVGIDDPYYFSKLFKKIIGKTAREYRVKQIPI